MLIYRIGTLTLINKNSAYRVSHVPLDRVFGKVKALLCCTVKKKRPRLTGRDLLIAKVFLFYSVISQSFARMARSYRFTIIDLLPKKPS